MAADATGTCARSGCLHPCAGGPLRQTRVRRRRLRAADPRRPRASATRAHQTAATAITSARARRFAARLEIWLQGRGWRADDGANERRAANIRPQYHQPPPAQDPRQPAEDIAELTIDERHELRIAVKKTRYGIEFFSGVLPAKRAARWTTALKHLQDSLGHLNDLDVAERTITRPWSTADGGEKARRRPGAPSPLAQEGRGGRAEIRKQCAPIALKNRSRF